MLYTTSSFPNPPLYKRKSATIRFASNISRRRDACRGSHQKINVANFCFYRDTLNCSLSLLFASKIIHPTFKCVRGAAPPHHQSFKEILFYCFQNILVWRHGSHPHSTAAIPLHYVRVAYEDDDDD